MSYLDNIENSLKALESVQERDSSEYERRQKRRADAIAAAPWAERLKNSRYVNELMAESVAVGRTLRAKVYIAWMDSVLRLEARSHFCELRPTTSGIEARYQKLSNGNEVLESIDLNGDPKDLLQRWLF